MINEADPGRAEARWRAELFRYRAARDERLRSEDGWLSLVARFVLSPGDNPIDLGTAYLHDGVVEVRVDAAVEARDADGQRVTTHRWPAGSKGGGPHLFVGSRRYELLRQGERAAIRVRDPNAPSRAAFPGLAFFEPDARFRVVARLVREGAPASIPLAQGLGGELSHPCPGALVFSIEGREHRLLPVIDDDTPGKYFLLFRDTTNGKETYGAGRFLYLDPADKHGEVELDFNRAFNPPCALTVHAACPVVPRENHLPIAITAGERSPPTAHG